MKIVLQSFTSLPTAIFCNCGTSGPPSLKKFYANSVMTPQSPVKTFTAKIFADSSESRGSSKKRIDDIYRTDD
jgi:hypothetical protein